MTRFRLVALGAVILTGTIALTRFMAPGSAPEPLPPGHERLVIPTADGNRECVIHVPPACRRGSPVPLVIMLHGMGGTALNALRETGWSAKADDETFIVVYPEATRPAPDRPPSFGRNPQAWNDGSGRFHAAEKRIDDVAFIRAVIERIAADHTVDDRRVFATGFSNGASMVFRLGAELSDRIAAIAPHAGVCWTDSPRPARAISVCCITGDADPLNPLGGGWPTMAFGGRQLGGRPKPAMQAVVDSWTRALDCAAEPRRDDTTDSVRTREYGPGRDGAEVVFITIGGLGHHWAGGVRQAPEFLLGATTDTLVATDVVWEFFRAHPAR